MQEWAAGLIAARIYFGNIAARIYVAGVRGRVKLWPPRPVAAELLGRIVGVQALVICPHVCPLSFKAGGVVNASRVPLVHFACSRTSSFTTLGVFPPIYADREQDDVQQCGGRRHF